MNTFGTHFRLTTFGASHDPYVGGVIDGCPAGLRLSEEKILVQLERRRSHHAASTPRKEADRPQFISGLQEWTTTGAPIAFLIKNNEARPKDYDHLENTFRPSHADYSYHVRYGGHEEASGGGRSSARESAVRVVAGAIAMQLLEPLSIEILSYTSQLGSHAMIPSYQDDIRLEAIQSSRVGCPDPILDQEMDEYLQEIATTGDTIGGVVSTIVRGLPAGWGSPIYSKLDAQLAAAMMSINAAKGFEVGKGFALASMRGSQANDPFILREGSIATATNHSGGIQGGVSNGAPLHFRTAFKPISSISMPQQTVTRSGEATTLTIQGRHDSSVFPRVLPIVDAMTALVLADEWLRSRSYLQP
ncbi:MAG: chorismate synthase [Porphyromonas sp.]|nr:chorismate synthase [Porphyromonas sp.]